MSGRAGIIGTIVAKDLKEFTRDRFYMVITVVGLAFYVLIFWVMPDTVDETIELGMVNNAAAGFFEQVADQGLEVAFYPTEDALRTAIEEGDDVSLGLSFPDDFVATVTGGGSSTVTVYVTGEVPPEVRSTVSALVRELGYLAAGEQPLVSQPTEAEVILGVDRAGDQISLREQMRPLFVFFVLLIEMMALGTLVAGEIHSRTVTAILATPARVSDFLIAKGISGTLLAFVQGLILVALIQSFGSQPALVVLALLLGSIMAAGFGLMAGSIGRDFITIVFWSMLILIPLIIPAIAVMFPGTAAAWIKAIPSYPLVDIIVGATAFDQGFGDLAGSLLALAGWCVLVFLAGWVILRRRVVTL
ncbi:MAG: ABC transporter permease [Acidimicrobiia bacterium]|nr:ABC transporter permease [Acidimicrobiia bacterium]NNL27631.1 ABC transporter permease [Acidimicrobiia bacterium]